MGEVYRARDPRLGRDVAVKVIASDGASSADRLRRFEQEARALATLNHPQILAVHDIGTHEGRPYAVFELLEGETLRGRLKRGALPASKAIEISAQVCRALAAAHGKGILHRDLKPENVFLTGDGQVKLLDFGLARLIEPAERATEETPTRTATEAGTVLGTAGYMSPEQVRGQVADARSDIFALGAMLYEMLSGRLAFGGATGAERLAAILNEDPPEIVTAIGGLSPSLARVLKRCLEKDPEERFQTARDLRFALEAVASDSGRLLRPEGPAARRTSLPWFVSAALLLTVAAAMWAVLRGRDRPPPRFTQLTFRRGTLMTARFTADGKTVVYSAAWDDGPPEIFSRRLDRPETTSLGLPPADVLSVSSRSELAILLYPKNELGQNFITGTLAIAPLSGGTIRPVLEDVFAADWSPDGRDLALIRWKEGQRQLEYPVGNVLRRPCSCDFPRVSPQGDRLAVWENERVVILDRDGKTIATVLGLDPMRIAWTPRGDSLLMGDGDRGGQVNRSIRRVTLDGKVTELYTLAGTLVLHDVSQDGRILLHHGFERIGARSRAPGEADEREMSVFASSLPVGLSADGGRLLLTDGGGAAEGSLFLRPTRGGPAVKLGDGRAGALSPDGRWVVVGDAPNDALRLTLVPTGVGDSQTVPVGSLRQCARAVAWHVDPHRVGFYAAEAGHGCRSYSVDLPGGEPRAVTPEGTLVVPDILPGDKVLGLSSDRSLALYPLAGGTPEPLSWGLPADHPALKARRVSGDGRYLFVQEGSLPARIDRIELGTGGERSGRFSGPVTFKASGTSMRHS
jgi:hypothetical protein